MMMLLVVTVTLVVLVRVGVAVEMVCSGCDGSDGERNGDGGVDREGVHLGEL